MKNLRKNIFVIAVFIVTVALIVINRNSTQAQIDIAEKMQLSFFINGAEKVYCYDESHSEFKSFDTQLKRKNGDIFEKNYSGIPMASILEDMNIQPTDSSEISVVCADQYEIILTADEILAENNIWLITQESHQKLPDNEGPFMLVINNDEFSTRWAKNVIRVKVK